jgi:hypothetical protein
MFCENRGRHTKNTVRRYAVELLEEMLRGARPPQTVMNVLKGICIELDYARFLFGFYRLPYAQEDLVYSDMQHYWPGADRSNIEIVIFDYARRWIEGVEDYPTEPAREQ